jgi:hypothetical protein
MKFIVFCLLLGFMHTDQWLTVSEKTTIEGVVLGKEDNRPLANAYVYVTKGEEEAVTDRQGRFRLITWQNLPVTITAEYPGYKKLSLQARKQGEKLLFELPAK